MTSKPPVPPATTAPASPRRRLVVIGSVLTIVTMLLGGLWWQAHSHVYGPPYLCTGYLATSPDDSEPACGPPDDVAAAQVAATWYGCSAVVTGVLAAGLLAGAVVRRHH